MEDRKLLAQIESARAHLKRVLTQRANLAMVLTGGFGSGAEFEFPEPDTAEAYNVLLGHRAETPTVWRLSFGSPLKWVGISHPWGVKPADIIVSPADIIVSRRR